MALRLIEANSRGVRTHDRTDRVEPLRQDVGFSSDNMRKPSVFPRRPKLFPLPLSRRLLLWPYLGGIIVDHRAGHRARREFVGTGLGNGGNLGAGAGDETFLKAGEFLRRDAPLDHLDAAPLREVD